LKGDLKGVEGASECDLLANAVKEVAVKSESGLKLSEGSGDIDSAFTSDQEHM